MSNLDPPLCNKCGQPQVWDGLGWVCTCEYAWEHTHLGAGYMRVTQHNALGYVDPRDAHRKTVRHRPLGGQ